jgi:hypothetical protein
LKTFPQFRDVAAWVRQPDNPEILAALGRAIAKGTAQQVK